MPKSMNQCRLHSPCEKACSKFKKGTSPLNELTEPILANLLQNVANPPQHASELHISILDCATTIFI